MHVFFDTETHRFRPGVMAPPIVCVQFCVDEGRVRLMTKRGEFADGAGNVSGPTENTFSSLLAHWITQGATLVGHHTAYDLACFCAGDPSLVPLVFRHYRESKVTDTMLRQKLADIGRGKHRGFQAGCGWVPLNYDLGSVGGRHGYRVDKHDPWRMYYALLDDVPLADWAAFSADVADLRRGAPTGAMVEIYGPDAIRYALGDAHATRAAYCGQARYGAEYFVDEYQQARKFWALNLASIWGLRTSLRGVMSLEKGAREHRDSLAALLLAATPEPLLRPKTKRPGAPLTRDTKAAMRRIERAYAELGLPARRTAKDGICLDSDACKSSGDPMLEAYADYSSMAKVLSNDVEMLSKGVVTPIHTRFDLADTGRVTSSKPNVMNPRRLPGVRECYVPRGYRE